MLFVVDFSLKYSILDSDLCTFNVSKMYLILKNNYLVGKNETVANARSCISGNESNGLGK